MPDVPSIRPDLPRTFWQALLRGARGRCPRCGEGQLFRRWLKPVERCAACTLDLTPQRADDLPAYIAIIVTGHLLAPVMIALSAEAGLSVMAILAIIIPLAMAMLLAMLQPAKGSVIAVQWWHGLHGFIRERSAEIPSARTRA